MLATRVFFATVLTLDAVLVVALVVFPLTLAVCRWSQKLSAWA